MFDILGYLFIITFCWIISCLIINTFFMIMPFYKKIVLDIYLPKPKKYLVKVNPIYELRQENYGSNYYIHKWELEYYINEMGGFFNAFLIPYPINFFTYRYEKVNSIMFGKEPEIENVTYEEMVKFYETENEEYIKEYEESKKETNKLITKINLINKTFNENYD